MFKIMILDSWYNLSDDQREFQIKDRISLMRFLGLSLDDTVPDAKTIWLFRRQLTGAGLDDSLNILVINASGVAFILDAESRQNSSRLVHH
jgi:IS5 family transposase